MAAGPGESIQSLSGFQVVIQNIGQGRHHKRERALGALEVRDQHLDRGVGPPSADLGDAAGESLRSSVRQVVAVHRRDDNVVETEGPDGVGDAPGFRRIDRPLPAVRESGSFSATTTLAGRAPISRSEQAGPR